MLSPAIQSLVAFVALASYLAAACLDCEPVAPSPGDLAPRMAALASHGLEASPSPSSSPSIHEPGSSGHDHASGHGGGHGGGHSSVHSSGHAAADSSADSSAYSGDPVNTPAHHAANTGAHARAASHAGSHEAHAARRVQRAIRAASDFAEWKATCPCGCGETRAQVGGNLSRLGSVVPGTHIAWLPEAGHVPGPGPWPPASIDVFTTLDPVPI